jgi:hypothetical protein
MHDAVGGGTGTDKMQWEVGQQNGEAIAGLRKKVREEVQNRLAALLDSVGGRGTCCGHCGH